MLGGWRVSADLLQHLAPNLLKCQQRWDSGRILYKKKGQTPAWVIRIAAKCYTPPPQPQTRTPGAARAGAGLR